MCRLQEQRNFLFLREEPTCCNVIPDLIGNLDPRFREDDNVNTYEDFKVASTLYFFKNAVPT